MASTERSKIFRTTHNMHSTRLTEIKMRVLGNVYDNNLDIFFSSRSSENNTEIITLKCHWIICQRVDSYENGHDKNVKYKRLFYFVTSEVVVSITSVLLT